MGPVNFRQGSASYLRLLVFSLAVNLLKGLDMFGLKRVTMMAMGILAMVTVIALGGDGYGFKCADKECGNAPTVIFGGGMMFDQAMGWCQHCKSFKSVQWTRPDSPLLDPQAKKTPQPKPLAEVWVATIGQTRKIYKCPGCEAGSFMEIRTPEELTHCPKCSKPGFKIDPNAPRLAVD